MLLQKGRSCLIVGGEGCDDKQRQCSIQVWQRQHRDTVFRLLFSDKARLLSLYNALSSKRCDNIDDLKVVTLQDAIYMEMKNDIAFLIGTDIHLWEHPLSLRSAYEFASANIAKVHRQAELLLKEARKATPSALCGVL